MPDSEPRLQTPFSTEPQGRAPAVGAQDPLAGDWSEGLRGAVRALGLSLPQRLVVQPGAAPAAAPGSQRVAPGSRPAGAFDPERTERADLRTLLAPGADNEPLAELDLSSQEAVLLLDAADEIPAEPDAAGPDAAAPGAAEDAAAPQAAAAPASAPAPEGGHVSGGAPDAWARAFAQATEGASLEEWTFATQAPLPAPAMPADDTPWSEALPPLPPPTPAVPSAAASAGVEWTVPPPQAGMLDLSGWGSPAAPAEAAPLWSTPSAPAAAGEDWTAAAPAAAPPQAAARATSSAATWSSSQATYDQLESYAPPPQFAPGEAPFAPLAPGAMLSGDDEPALLEPQLAGTAQEEGAESASGSAAHAARTAEDPSEPAAVATTEVARAAAPAASTAPEVLDDDIDLLVPVEEDVDFTPPPPLPGAAPAAAHALFMRGEHRVAVHTRGGRTRRGTVRNVDFSQPQFALIPQGGGAAEPVQASELKAVFFLLAPGEKPNAASGARLRITFEDGRTIEGARDGAEAASGFFLVPSDASRTTTRRIFVAREATQEIREN